MEKNCVFCRIIQGEESADFVHKDDTLVVFKDINPEAPVHLLIVPRKHICSINALEEDDRHLIAEVILRAKKIAHQLGIADSGYKLIFNVERGGGQIIFHLHLHLIGGW